MRAPLTLTDLNRTLLARQLLLSRRAMPLVRALEAVAGIQAQDPVAPLFGLLARLDGFASDELTRALRRRSVVRGTLLRGTVHLVSARDYLRLEPAVGPLIRGQHEQYLRGRPPMPDVAERTREAMAMTAEPVPWPRCARISARTAGGGSGARADALRAGGGPARRLRAQRAVRRGGDVAAAARRSRR